MTTPPSPQSPAAKCAEENLKPCPFCHDTDFDDVGLKIHLTTGHCEAFNELPIGVPITRHFPEPQAVEGLEETIKECKKFIYELLTYNLPDDLHQKGMKVRTAIDQAIESIRGKEKE